MNGIEIVAACFLCYAVGWIAGALYVISTNWFFKKPWKGNVRAAGRGEAVEGEP